jgi:hypothetical protein
VRKLLGVRPDAFFGTAAFTGPKEPACAGEMLPFSSTRYHVLFRAWSDATPPGFSPPYRCISLGVSRRHQKTARETLSVFWEYRLHGVGPGKSTPIKKRYRARQNIARSFLIWGEEAVPRIIHCHSPPTHFLPSPGRPRPTSLSTPHPSHSLQGGLSSRKSLQ